MLSEEPKKEPKKTPKTQSIAEPASKSQIKETPPSSAVQQTTDDRLRQILSQTSNVDNDDRVNQILSTTSTTNPVYKQQDS